MRKLAVSLILLAILLAVVDRVAVAGVQREIARQIAAKYDLATTPSVEVKGIPFLTQAIRGRYDEITIGIGPMTKEGVELTSVDATLYGVTAPLADLLQNAANARVEADRVTGTIVISNETLSARAPRGITITGGDGDRLSVKGTITFLGQKVPVTADLKIDIGKNEIRLLPVNVKLAGAISVPNPERFISFTIPVKNLPLNLKITQVRPTDEGLAVEGTAADVPLT